MGTLHIEMQAFGLLGDWLKGSGWTSALVDEDIVTAGVAQGLLSGKDVKRTRYAHTVTSAALFICKQRAYDAYVNDLPENTMPLPFTQWCDCKHQQQDPHELRVFKFWSHTLDLELLALHFVYSLCTANMPLYVRTLKALAPWIFGLDHVHYKRWLPVHICDMICLETTHPEVYEELATNGKFVGNKTRHPFSHMALDQLHEQLHELITGIDAGAVGLTEDAQKLLRWMLA